MNTNNRSERRFGLKWLQIELSRALGKCDTTEAVRREIVDSLYRKILHMVTIKYEIQNEDNY